MRLVAAVVLALLPLAPPFGEAEARAVAATGSTLTLEVTVEVLVGTQIVLVQPYGIDGAALAPVPLSSLGGGSWGTLVDVPRDSGIRLGFEVLDGGSRERSAVHTLVELGVDPAVFRDPLPAAAEPTTAPPSPGRRWGWLAVGVVTGIAAVGLAVTVLRPRRKEPVAGEAPPEAAPPEA
jgi:hypothetical protein